MSDWRDRAACRRVDPEMFHPDPADSADLPQHICLMHCPVREECAAWSSAWKWANCVIAGERWLTPDKGRVSRRDPAAVDLRACPMCADLIVHPAYSGPRLPMCGTRSGYARHKTRGEACDTCLEAERVYHRARRRK